MRVLLYDIESSRYYQSPVNWTLDPLLASDLQGTVQAVTVAFQSRLKTAEIILAFDENHLTDMRLPLKLANGANGSGAKGKGVNGAHKESCGASC